jgi:hypothetical protein
VTAEDSITWIIPNKNTMIKFDDVESEEDEIVVKYEGDDINKHKRKLNIKKFGMINPNFFCL